MKQQASISLKIVDNPIDSKAPVDSLLLRATSDGLKLFNSSGEEVQIGNGSSDVQHIFKVTEFPTSGMVDNSLYILESGEAKAYFAEGWIDISQEVVETIDDNASNDNIPTAKAVKDYVKSSGGSIDLSNYVGTVLLQGPESSYRGAFSINDSGVISVNGYTVSIGATTGSVSDPLASFNVNAGVINLHADGDGIRYNDAFLNQAGGLVQLNSDGKIPETLYNSGSFNGFTAEDISGSVISETVKTIKAGENIEFSEQDGVLTIKGTELESREDISFTADSLNDGKLTVSECSIGSCCVMDNNGNLVMPDQQQSGSEVILNLSGYTITGTWKVKFIQGRTGGVTPEYAQQMATTYAIIFGS